MSSDSATIVVVIIVAISIESFIRSCKIKW